MDVLSLVLSIIALVVSLYSVYRTERFRDFDYAVRLQLENVDNEPAYSLEAVIHAGDTPEKHHDKSDDPFFRVKYALRNAGKEPVDIQRIWLELGSKHDNTARERKPLIGHLYLVAGDHVPIERVVTRRQIREARLQYQLPDDQPCALVLRVEFKRPGSRRRHEALYTLGEFLGEEVPVFYMARDRAVT